MDSGERSFDKQRHQETICRVLVSRFTPCQVSSPQMVTEMIFGLQSKCLQPMGGG
jgi:hypothetical protein